MTRIATNIASYIARTRLDRNYNDLAIHLERLSTGLRINKGRDDPAGIIVSGRLQMEIAGISQALDNSSRTINVLSVAEAALGEVSNLLEELKGLIVNSANESGLSEEEIAANQLQMDSIIDSITRIADTTEFADRKLLDGTIGYNLSGQTISEVSHARIFAARLPDGQPLNVTVAVTASAELAQLVFNNGAATPLASAVSLEIGGAQGSEVLSFACGTSLSQIVSTVNQYSSKLGVTAVLSGTSAVVFNSTDYGSDEFVSITTITGNFITGAGVESRDEGVDAGVLINNQQAQADGLEVDFRSLSLDLELILDSTFAQQTSTTSTFHVIGGGAQFAISPFITPAGQIDLGIPSVRASQLGDRVNGFLYSLKSGQDNDLASGNFSTAEGIVDRAIDQVATLRGRLGAFEKNIVDTNVNSMQIALENVSAALSTIRDADMAEEISKLTATQILVQSNVQTLSLANQIPSNILQLLG
ncbi:MAG: hypothetical protein HJJLKODD_00218 [Phycisphaerae bacterium]|nr:hypothetical protein [Phycisphaerae bacterium]